MAHKISFTAIGTIEQTIEITNGESIKTVIEKLNSNEYLTTILDDGSKTGSKIVRTSDFSEIGKIIATENELEYNDFEIE